METIWDNVKFLFQLYASPQRAMSNIIDRGSWLFVAVLVLLVSFAFQSAINSRLNQAFGIPRFDFETYRQPVSQRPLPNASQRDAEQLAEAEYRAAFENYQTAVRERRAFPFVGAAGLWLFNFNSTNFLGVLLSLLIFYVPATILLLTFFEPVGSFGLLLRRDYGVFSTCAMTAWAAAHLPFAVAGLFLRSIPVDPHVLLALWLASGAVFGVFMVFAVRTVFGASYKSAVAVVCLSWLSISLGSRIFDYISPFLFSPFLLLLLFAYFRGEAATFGNAFRQRQDFRRFLNNAALNPHDAEAHVQLGILYKQRRQTDLAAEHFRKAIEIDSLEIDANYELGKIRRENGDLHGALEHFGIVAEQNDKYAQSEIWREIGATYLDAKAYMEAREFLEKFVERRSHDPEGLYLLGETLKALGETEAARVMFRLCVEAVQTSPDYRRGQQRRWAKLAQKEISA